MGAWLDRIVREFPADLARFWIVADPDDILLNEQVLAELRARDFEVLPYEDPIAFRWDYEDRYRAAWDSGRSAPAKALILHIRGTSAEALPWDYLRQARQVSLSLADLFPDLSYPVVRDLNFEQLEVLFDAQGRLAPQRLGDAATRDFILMHVFRIGPHLITRPEDLWRELLKLHFNGAALPPGLAAHVGSVLRGKAVAEGLSIADLFASKPHLLRLVQAAWIGFLTGAGPTPDAPTIPFDHPDVRGYVESLFRDGLLQPVDLGAGSKTVPSWAKFGVLNPADTAAGDLAGSIGNLLESLPSLDASHREWLQISSRLGEVLHRFNTLPPAAIGGLADRVLSVQLLVDDRLRQWVERHYADLPSLPPAKAPAMLHHVPRFLSLRRGAGETKIALLVFDGLAMDQWIQIREHLKRETAEFGFEDGACFAWAPTLTSVSRQALFSGLKPREFADSIASTAREPALWSRFWQDHGLRANEVVYRKGVRRGEQLADLETALGAPAVKVAGVVIDTVDEIVHGAVLGKRGVAAQIESWCDTGFVSGLLRMLHARNFHVYLTADHGNVEAVGVGRLNQGEISELKGERVRVYRSETLASAAPADLDAFRLDIAGLPADFLPLFAGKRGAFATRGDPMVAHGGLSAEELLVPFVKVTDQSRGA